MARFESLGSLIVLLGGGCLLAAASDLIALPGWLRLCLTLVFVAYGPGHGWVRALKLPEPWLELALTVAVSLALTLGVAMAMVNLGMWTVPGGLALLLAVSTLGVFVRRWRADAPEARS